MDFSYTQILVSIDAHVATVTLNNPPVNALSRQLYDELTHAMDVISTTDDVRSAILTGAGKIFSAGADLKARAQMQVAADLHAHSRRSRECFHAVRECAKPVIAAINGPALGAGLLLVASCDILLASTEAKIGLPEIDVGLMGGGRHAMRLLGHSKVRRMVLTGERVSGEELYRRGVVEHCTPPDELMPAAFALARSIAAKSPLATRLAKQTLNTIEGMALREGQRFEQEMTAVLSRSDDAKEAQLAFREKRLPVFRGR